MSTEMFFEWMGLSWAQAALIALSSLGIYVAVIAFTRLFGLRSFSKMSSFDFAATVAVGSIMAGTLTMKIPSLGQGVVGLFCLYLLQRIVAVLRQRTDFVEAAVNNTPVLLMDGQTLCEKALRKTGITKSDVRAKLREANVLKLSQVRAVVLETTGDISVLHTGQGTELEDELLEGVRRYD